MGYLTTATDVKKTIDITNEFTDVEIETYIVDTEYDIFSNNPSFKRYSEIEIDSEYDSNYFIGERNKDVVYSITKIREEVDTTVEASGWSEIGSDTFTLISYSPAVTVPEAVQTGSDAVKYRIDWIPYNYHRLATLKTKEALIKRGLIFTNPDADNIPLAQVKEEIATVMKSIKPKTTFKRSSLYEGYDSNTYVEYEQYHTD